MGNKNSHFRANFAALKSNKMDKGGGEKILYPETVKYELGIFVTSDDGESIELYPEFKHYDGTREFPLSCMLKFHATAIQESRSDQIITSNKLLQLVPVEIICNVERLLLTWDKSVMERFPIEIFGFEDLQELKIDSGNRKNPGCCLRHLPQEIGDLKKLGKLIISDCMLLEDIPSKIGNLENLEELAICGCDSLLHLPSEIGNLKRLRRLDILWCNRLEDLPSTIGNLESLEELSVYHCYCLTRFPSETSNLKCLRKLNIETIATDWNGTEDFRLKCTNLMNLQEMRIVSCGSLVHFPQEIGNLKCLQKLWIQRCNELENLPSVICNIESLQEMVIIDCRHIDALPLAIGNLRWLRKLEITMPEELYHEVNRLQFIPLEVVDLLNLQELNISYGGCLDHLSLVINKLKSISRLNINYGGRGYGFNSSYPFERSFDGRVLLGLKFKMTLEELHLDVRVGETVDNIENLNNFLRSLSAENSLSSPMSSFLPQGIRCIKFDDSRSNVRVENLDEVPIRKLLKKCPRIGKVCFFDRNSFHHFSADTLHMMYWNRFVRSLQYEASTSGDRNLPSLLTENVWPIILEEVQTRIRKDSENPNWWTLIRKNPTTISAGVIYSVVRELVLPFLIEH